jgi:hypothetical protein
MPPRENPFNKAAKSHPRDGIKPETATPDACLWNVASGGKKCRKKAVPGTHYCQSHLKELEVRAIKHFDHDVLGFLGNVFFPDSLPP